MGAADRAASERQLAEELSRTHPSQERPGFVEAVLEDVSLAGEDQVETRRRLTLFDDVRTWGEPGHLDVVVGVSERGRLPCEEGERTGEVARTMEALAQAGEPLGEPVDQQQAAPGEV